MSIAWSLGTLLQVDDTVQAIACSSGSQLSRCISLDAQAVVCKIGNCVYSYPLQSRGAPARASATLPVDSTV
jgi:hypothetical protein